MNWRRLLICLLFACLSFTSIAERPTVVHFELSANFIIVEVRINRFPMHFIFDTGAEHSILFKREIADLLELKFERKIQVYGADLNDSTFAFISRRVEMDLDPLKSNLSDILIMEKSLTNLDKLAGRSIDGILGSQFFKNYKFQIDFTRRQIKFYKELPKKKIVKHSICQLNIHKNKPYMVVPIAYAPNKHVDLNLLFDTGASIHMMLHNNTHENIDLPENNISTVLGAGVGGLIYGHVGRVESMKICKYELQNILTNYQDMTDVRLDSSQVYRHGVIGNGILKRFNVIFDYINSVIYLKPTKQFKNKNDFDKSGILLGSTGVDFNEHIIVHVMKSSPAEESGLQRGDKIIKVNGIKSTFYDLSEVSQKFRKKEGKRVRLVINRNGDILKKEVVLRSLI